MGEAPLDEFTPFLLQPFAPRSPDTPLRPGDIYGAMLGNPGIEFDFDPNSGTLDTETGHPDRVFVGQKLEELD